jgi:sulfatase modifying factor 1
MSDERRRIAEEKARLERERLELERRELDLERRENEAKRRALEARERAVEGRAPPPEPGEGRDDESGQMSFRNILARRDVIINVVTGGGIVVLIALALSLAVGYFSDVGGLAIGFMMIAAFFGAVGIIWGIIYRSMSGMVASGALSSVAMAQASATSGGSVGAAAVCAVYVGVTLGDTLGGSAEPDGGPAYAGYRFIPNVVAQAKEKVSIATDPGRHEADKEKVGGGCVKKCSTNEIVGDGCECKCIDGHERVGGACLKVCGAYEKRDGWACKCDEGYEKVEGKCVEKCGVNEERLSRGGCGCIGGYEKEEGKCVEKCGENGQRGSGGGCECVVGHEKVKGKCVVKCGESEQRGSGGGCECVVGYEKVEGQCVKKCGVNEKRVSRVACEKVPEEESRCPKGMAFIAGGSFGGHTVGDFCMDITEVTVAAFGDKATEANKGNEYCNTRHTDRGSHPMNCVSWDEAKAHCAARGKRLPTEWEWEWAARGREEGRKYPWGDAAPTCRLAVMSEGGYGCGKDRTWAVGSKSPAGDTRDGLKDMSGNVWEWTSSSDGEKRVLRGGGWHLVDAGNFSASNRVSNHPTIRNTVCGFRCARTAR